MESNFLYVSYALGLLVLMYAFLGLTHLSTKSFSQAALAQLKAPGIAFVPGVLKGFLIQGLLGRLANTEMFVLGTLYLDHITWRRGLQVLVGAGLASIVYWWIITVMLAQSWLYPSIIVCIFGFIAIFVFRSDLYRVHGKRLFYIGLFMLGFAWINSVHQFVSDDMTVEGTWFWINQNVFWIFVFSFLVGVFSQSSFLPGVLGLSLLHLGLISFEAGFAALMGSFVGAPLGTLLAVSRVDQRGNVMLGALTIARLIAVALSLIWLPWVLHAESLITLSASQMLVAVFALVQVTMIVMLAPFQDVLEQTALSMCPQAPATFQRIFANVPGLNFEVVATYILQMAQTVQAMLSRMCTPFEEKTRDAMIIIDEDFDLVEIQARQVNFYLSKMNLDELSYRDSQKETHWFQISHALKNMASLINRNIMEIASQKKERGFDFDPHAWKRLVECHHMLEENFDRMVDNLRVESSETLKSILRNQKQIHSLKEEIKQEYLQNVRTDDSLSLEGTAAFLSLLSQLQFLNISISRMAYPTIDRRRTT